MGFPFFRSAPAPARRGRFTHLDPVGVVDIGSNSVRLVVYEGAVRAPTQLFNEKELCGLGKGFTEDNRLNEKAVQKALRALKRFRTIAETLEVVSLRAVATAAVRDASDGADFIARVSDILGIEVEVLSGEREAELAASGIRMGFVAPDGVAGDLGGGSLELIRLKNGDLKNAVTLPLGGLKLAEQSGGKMSRAVSEIKSGLGSVSWLGKSNAKVFYAVGGTWRSLVKLHMAHSDYPVRVMHNYEIETQEAIEFCESVRRARNFEDFPHVEEISPPRRPIVPIGAAVLEHTLKVLRPKKVVFSVFGIREGLLFEHLTPEEADRDPLLAFCEDYAHLRSRDPEHPPELIKWTDPIFAAEPWQETDEVRRLRWAACWLSDIGWRANRDYRGPQSMNVVAHSAMIGVDHPERIFLSLTLSARHDGPGEADIESLPPNVRALMDKTNRHELLFRAKVLSAAIRAEHTLSLGHSGIVKDLPVRVEDGKLILSVPPHRADLIGGRVERRFQSLAKLLDLEFVIEWT